MPAAHLPCANAKACAALVPACIASLLCACTPAFDRQAGPDAPLAPPTAFHLYVASTGDDNNAGSESAPFLTISRAAQAALPDTTIHVAPGDYPGGIRTTVSGTEKSRIYFISTTPGGARIVPPAKSLGATAWDNRGSYVDIVGFEVDGRAYRSGQRWINGIYSAGSFDSLRHNVVHHIANGAPCGNQEGAAITMESYFRGVQGEVIGNKIYDVGELGCPAVQGIAINTSALVANNLVFRSGNAGIYLWHDANHVRVVNNTVTGSTIGILVGGGNFYLTVGPNDYSDISNNIVFDNNTGVIELGATGKHNTYRNNLVFGNPSGDWALAPGQQALATVAADPRFSAYQRTILPDFSLAAGSPAIGKGDPAHSHPVDFNGTRRDKAAGIDLGALQHQRDSAL